MRSLPLPLRACLFAVALCAILAGPAAAATLAGPTPASTWCDALGDQLATLGLFAVGIVAGAQELIDKRLKLIEQGKAIIDLADKEKRDLTAEEDAQFKAIHKEANELRDKANDLIAAHKRDQERRAALEEHEKDLKALETHGINLQNHRGSAASRLDHVAEPTAEDVATAIQGWFLQNSDSGDPLDDRHLEAAKKCRINVHSRVLTLHLPQNYAQVKQQFYNALSTKTAGGGGATVPSGLLPSLEVAMLQFGGMLRTSDVMRTRTGNPLGWPTANDTGNMGRQIGEGKAAAELDPSFAALVWNAYKFTSDEVLVSFELMRDSAIDLVRIVGEMLGERLGRILNRKFTTGTGAGTCWGILLRSVLGKTAASPTAITSDELLDLQHSVDEAYRNGPGVGWMFHDDVALALRKLKDSNGRYHWQDGMQAGQPDILFTKPVTINNDMPGTIATGNKTILFGDLSKYKVRQVGNVRIYRLTERHRENDQDAFLAFTEADGNLLDAGTNPVKHLAQA